MFASKKLKKEEKTNKFINANPVIWVPRYLRQGDVGPQTLA